MKSLDPVKKSSSSEKPAEESAEKEAEAIDFSKVKVKPLFEELVDFDTFIKSDWSAWERWKAPY